MDDTPDDRISTLQALAAILERLVREADRIDETTLKGLLGMALREATVRLRPT